MNVTEIDLDSSSVQKPHQDNMNIIMNACIKFIDLQACGLPGCPQPTQDFYWI